MGGAAIGDDDIGVQALRVRAAENFIWLVVAQRGSGAMIISPQGRIVAQADGADGLAVLRRAGWYTIAQDQASSVVYGMPKAAAEVGAAMQILPPEAIAFTLAQLFGENLP